MFIVVFSNIPQPEVLDYIRAHGGQVLVPEGAQPTPQTSGTRRLVVRLNGSATTSKTIKRLSNGGDIELHIKYADHAYPQLIIVKTGTTVKVAHCNGTAPQFAIKKYGHDQYIAYLRSALNPGRRLRLVHTFDDIGAEVVQGVEDLCRELDISPNSILPYLP